MPAKRKDDDGPDTGVQAFAAELRAQRESAGLTQAQLAKSMGYSESVIAKLETCRTIPSPQHAAQADSALRTPGTFRRLRQTMLNGAHEPWVRAFLDSEAAIEQLVAARMARQDIWEREDPEPPVLSVILGEAVLRQPLVSLAKP